MSVPWEKINPRPLSKQSSGLHGARKTSAACYIMLIPKSPKERAKKFLQQKHFCWLDHVPRTLLWYKMCRLPSTPHLSWEQQWMTEGIGIKLAGKWTIYDQVHAYVMNRLCTERQDVSSSHCQHHTATYLVHEKQCSIPDAANNVRLVT